MNAQIPPVFPDVRVVVRSRNRWAVAAAVRQAMRRAGKDRRQIDRFVAEAVAADSPESLRHVCEHWVACQLPS